MSVRPPSRAPRELRRPAQDARRGSLPPGPARQQTPGASTHNAFDPRTRFLDSNREQRRQIRLLPGNHIGSRTLIPPPAGVGYHTGRPPIYSYSPVVPGSNQHFQENGQYYSSQPTQWYGTHLMQDNLNAAAPGQDPWLNEPGLHSQPPPFTTPADDVSSQSTTIDPEVSRRKISRPVSHSTATPLEISRYNDRLIDDEEKALEDHKDKRDHEVQINNASEIHKPSIGKRKYTPDTGDDESRKKSSASILTSNEQPVDFPKSTGSCACHEKSKPSISIKDFTTRLRDTDSSFTQYVTSLALTNDATGITKKLGDAVDDGLQLDDHAVVERVTHGIFLGNVLADKFWEIWKPIFGDVDAKDAT